MFDFSFQSFFFFPQGLVFLFEVRCSRELLLALGPMHASSQLVLFPADFILGW